MIEALFELLGEGIEWVTDLFSGGIGEVISTAMLIGGVITVANLTENAIRNELKNRQELKNKGVISVVIEDIKNKGDFTVVSLAALNANNAQVGRIKMSARASSGIKKGDKIKL